MFSVVCIVGKFAGNSCRKEKKEIKTLSIPVVHTLTQDVGALPDVVLHILLPALVGDLGQPGLLAGEGLVQVEELELRVRQVPKLRGEDGSLERGQGSLELRGDQSQRLVLDAKLLVGRDTSGHGSRGDGEQAAVE